MILLTKHNFGLQCLQVLWPTGRVSPDMVGASIGRAQLSGSPDTLSYHNRQAGVQQPEEQDCKYWHFQVDRTAP